MLSQEIRRAFLAFFENNNHKIIPSASIVPQKDPSLLFTSAGMVPFKDYFLGMATPPAQTLTSSQKCVRAGGKHNDLDNVGYTKRHHTFFEMLGNFSFGPYFKEQAIVYAWEFLTKTLGLDANKLSVTYYHTDEETRALWKKIIPESRITAIATSDNFWSMGPVGPCGPCTEIFYDFAEFLDHPEQASEEERFVEIWNLVFMQFNAQKDGSLEPLKIPCVDTGMGLERLACILQRTDNNYNTDIFRTLKESFSQIAQVSQNAENQAAFNVIADHIRCATFLVSDGVFPDNMGRGYVLRKILRRAMRYAHKLGPSDPILHKLCSTVVQTMGQDFPDIATHEKLITQTVLREEERFGEIFTKGLKVFQAELHKNQEEAFSPKLVFDLYDTYGFPLDVTYELLRNHNRSIDKDAVNSLMEEQRTSSQKNWKGSGDASVDAVWTRLAERVQATQFVGYTEHEASGKILAIIKDGADTPSLEGTGWVVTDTTPFYAESGGQVGDTGAITTQTSKALITDTQKPASGMFAHLATVSQGSLCVGDHVTLTIDTDVRTNITAHHTATHLLHKALHTRFSASVVQKGSYVCSKYLRFDFHHPDTLTQEDIMFLEEWVNTRILTNAPVTIKECSQEQARSLGAIGLFGEKYGDTVRVVSIGEDGFSREFCGGCHVTQTGAIGLFHILSHQSVGADTKRITACVGINALQKMRAYKQSLSQIQKALGVAPEAMLERIRSLQDVKKSGPTSKVLRETQEDIKGVSFNVKVFSDGTVNILRQAIDEACKQKRSLACAANICSENKKVSLVVGISHDLAETLSASDLARQISTCISDQENGGGRKNFAQCGGTKPENLEKAFAVLRASIR